MVWRRRKLLLTLAAAGASLPGRSKAQAATYRRWEITDPAMPASVLDSYQKGIAAMLKLPPTDPRNWYRNAFLHVLDCPHGNWWFLAWHRGYLGWLEQTLRDLSGDAQFALPYWDWTKTPQIPAAMFSGVLDPDNAAYIDTFAHFRATFGPAVNALWSKFSAPQRTALGVRGLNSTNDFWASTQQMFFARPIARGLTATSPAFDSTTQVAVGLPTLTAALQTPIFAGPGDGTSGAGFASGQAANHTDESDKGILESQPHDNVHGAMGGASGQGFMVSFLSPVDPIFFLHHGNLDRLWDVWTRRQTALKLPALPEGADLATWSGESFLFFTDSQGQPVSKTKAGDYASPQAFGYDYSPGSGEDQVPQPALVAAAQTPTLRAFSLQLAPRPGGAAGGAAPVPQAALRPVQSGAPPNVAEVTLNVQAADLGRRFRVLVSAAGGTPVEAGGITIFNHHAMGPVTFTVPLPAGVQPGSGAGANVPLDVQVIPFSRPSPPATPGLRPLATTATRPVPLQAIRVLAP